MSAKNFKIALVLIGAFVCVDFFTVTAHSEIYDLFGEPIAEKEIKISKGKLNRVGWTVLYGEIGFFIGLGVDRTIKPQRKHPGVASLVGAIVGGGWGYLYGNRRDREIAIGKINRSRRQKRMKEGISDETLRARAMMQEAIEINMGNGYRWGYTILGFYVGMGTGLVAGYGLKYINVMIPGGALGTLIGVWRGYLKGEEKDRQIAEEKARQWLLKQGIRPENTYHSISYLSKSIAVRLPEHHSETDHIWHLVVIRF